MNEKDQSGGQPTQKTLKGNEIPLPKRREIMDALKKIAGKAPKQG
jgi:hypothetical protein